MGVCLHMSRALPRYLRPQSTSSPKVHIHCPVAVSTPMVMPEWRTGRATSQSRWWCPVAAQASSLARQMGPS